ncbi:uncharacterized protein [Neodiprion pinetum]|uniref:uncharacterized protein n=1 Tax=Neodiprion pinetum TaxID=441929 RepID=UPI00371746C9
MEVESIFVIKLQNEIQKLTKKLSTSTVNYESCMNDRKRFKFYTGLMPEDFDILWNFLGPPTESSLMIWHSRSDTNKRITIKQFKALSLKNQLFLTLVRLRCGFLLYDLSCRFGVSMGYIFKLTTTWIQLMHCKFKQLNNFPSAKDINKNLPQAFKKFKNVRVIIDCFEWNMENPKNFSQQGNTYSTYKSHNTVKFLIGIIPTGGCCFLSEGFEGRITDRSITEKSGFLKYLEKGDLILADRGFNIEDLCNKYKCTVLMPSFLKSRKKFTKNEVKRAREIASARIHVERFIGRMKQFRIMQRIIPKTLLPIVSQIVFVIAMLVNFQEPLVT